MYRNAQSPFPHTGNLPHKISFRFPVCLPLLFWILHIYMFWLLQTWRSCTLSCSLLKSCSISLTFEFNLQDNDDVNIHDDTQKKKNTEKLEKNFVCKTYRKKRCSNREPKMFVDFEEVHVMAYCVISVCFSSVVAMSSFRFSFSWLIFRNAFSYFSLTGAWHCTRLWNTETNLFIMQYVLCERCYTVFTS